MSASPSKRWVTTTASAMEDVVRSRGGETADRSAIMKSLKNAKLASTKGSISFGHEKVSYISDTHEQQINALVGQSNEDRLAQQKRIKDMKKGLVTTNFNLGDEPVVYESTNREAMKQCAKVDPASARSTMNSSLKEAVKKSSLYFGNEPVTYRSVAADGFTPATVDIASATNIATRKQELKSMKDRLTRHNFTLGEERVDYTTDYASGFSGYSADAYKGEKTKLKAQVEEIRKCHFSLGHDKVEYVSDCHRALDQIKGNKPADVAHNLEHAKQMKAALQKTSIVIGDDTEYM